MKIIMIGTIHDTLDSYAGLYNLFKKFAITYISPNFVAVEYDEIMFENKIVPLRQAYIACKNRIALFPNMVSDHELSILANCIGRDGDTHKQFYPQTQTIWLDSGREPPASYFKNECGSQLYNLIVRYLNFKRSSLERTNDDDMLLKFMATERHTTSQSHDKTRDARWLEILKPYLKIHAPPTGSLWLAQTILKMQMDS